MNSKKLIGMAAALLVLAAIALVQRHNGRFRPAAAGDRDATLLQGVDLNAITQMEVSQGSNQVVLVKKDGAWRVDSLYGYPADFGRLADALRSMADVKTGRPVRSQNIGLAEYGLDSAAKRIVLKAGEKAVATIEVGARRDGADSAGWSNQYFIRKDGKETIYLVDYGFQPFTGKAEDWIDRSLLNVGTDDIVDVKSGDVELKVDGKDWTLVGLDKDKEELESSEANKPRMALQYLDCATVADPAKKDDELGFASPVVFTAQTTNKTYTVVLGGTAPDGRYVRFSGDVDKKLSGWTYVIDANKADDMLVSREKLVKPKAPPATEASTNAPPAVEASTNASPAAPEAQE